jgi:hypothetical protein
LIIVYTITHCNQFSQCDISLLFLYITTLRHSFRSFIITNRRMFIIIRYKKKYYKKFLSVLKKCCYKYIYKGLHPTFHIGIWKGKRFGFTPPPGRFSTLYETICLFLCACDTIWLFYVRYAWQCDTLRMVWLYVCCGVCVWCVRYVIRCDTIRVHVYGMLASSVTSSRCIMSGVVLCRVPCASAGDVPWSGLCCVLCLVSCALPLPCADTLPLPIRVCMYTYYDTIRGAQRSVYSNAYSTPYKTNTRLLW